MDDDLSPIKIGSRVGDYIITQKLGQGGMCVVYKAIDPGVARYVAIKVMLSELSNTESLSDFMEEAKFIALMRHTNIVPLYSVGQIEGIPWLAMGYIEGQDMDAYLEENGSLGLDEAMSFFKQAAQALQHAAKSNVIHLDIKPANFIRDRSGVILLADFGVARRISDGDKGLFDGQPVQGTPSFCSPEHVLRRNLDIRSDIYSLGATVFTLLTGTCPYNADDMMEIIRMHMKAPFPEEILEQHEIPPGWRKCIKKMMEKDPADRFQSYEQLLTALESIKTFVHGRVDLRTSFEGLRHSLPRVGGDPNTLFSMLPADLVIKGEDLFRVGRPYKPESVMETLESRWPILYLNSFADKLKTLQVHDDRDLEDIMFGLGKMPEYRDTVDSLVNFMATDMEEAVIGTQEEKLKFLGLDRARNLAIVARALAEDWQPARPLNHQHFWQHSIYTGLMSSFIVDALHLELGGMEFTCGLLHNIGRLVYLELYPNKAVALWMKAYQECVPLEELEHEYFGLTHFDIGAEWLSRHKFSKSICAVIGGAGSSNWSSKGGITWTSRMSRHQVETLSVVTACADSLVRELGLGYVGSPYVPELPWLEQDETEHLLDYTEHPEATLSRTQFGKFFLETCQAAPDLAIANGCSSDRATKARAISDAKKATELRAEAKKLQFELDMQLGMQQDRQKKEAAKKDAAKKTK